MRGKAMRDDDVNEDNIGVTDAGTLSEGTAIDLDPPRREINRGGRPKGYPKSGGRTAPIRNAAIQAKIAKHWDELIDFNLRVMRGEPMMTTGPTGKRYKTYPSLSQRQQASTILFNLSGGPGDQIGDQGSPKPDVAPNEAELRRAMLEYVGRHAPQSSPPPVIDPIASPLADPTDAGSEVISLSHDPSAIAEHDRGVRNAGSKKAKPRFDENNPQLGDRLDLPCGFYAIYESDFFGSKRQRWVLYNSAHDRLQFKHDAAAVRKHFWENTNVGQAEAKRLEAEGKTRDDATVTPVDHTPLVTSAKSNQAVDEYYGDASTHPSGGWVVNSHSRYKIRDRRNAPFKINKYTGGDDNEC